MNREKKIYTVICAIRYLFLFVLFVSISSFSNIISYFIAQRMTSDVDENVILLIHIGVGILAYHSCLSSFALTDKVARKKFYESNITKKEYFKNPLEAGISFAFLIVFFLAFLDAFAVKSLSGLFGLKREISAIIMFCVFTLIHILTWIESLIDWRKTEEKLRKEKNDRKEIWLLVKRIVSICLAYPIMSYIIPIFVPTLRTLPRTLFVLGAVIVPIIIVFVLFLFSFDYIRAFFVRKKFIGKLKKAAKKNVYSLSKIKYPYISLIKDHDGYNFTVKAHGKIYSCKFLAGISYGDPMYFEEEGKGRIIRHISLRYRTARGAPFAKGGLIWQKLPVDLMQFHTEFSYGFDGEGTKVLLINPTPHSIYAVGHGEQRLIDVNDKIFGYTVMTGTAFINALERDAVK